ncbi:MAG: response regulator [Alcanivoracaceae bacterium]
MTLKRILPYYHPSTIVFVDDNERFLDSFTLLLSEELAFRSFSHLRAALDFINHSQTTPLDQRCISLMGRHSGGSGAVRLDLALIEQEISNPNRFQEVSVVVVDYDMPEMNGLAFCEAIQNPRIKKVLLTGVGDEKVAVKAFNEGLIDRFLTKNDPDIGRKINETISDLQRAYFRDLSTLIQNMLALKSADFIQDEAFIATFLSIKTKLSIVEYYYVEEPNGFLMVSCEGKLYRLIVCNESDIDEQIFSIRRLSPPKSLMAHLAQRKSLLWLWMPEEDIDEDESFDWQDYAHPATKVEGRQVWYFAIVDNPPADIEYDSEASSYASYLAELDAHD